MNRREKPATRVQIGTQNINHARENPCSQHLKPTNTRSISRTPRQSDHRNRGVQYQKRVRGGSANMQNIMTWQLRKIHNDDLLTIHLPVVGSIQSAQRSHINSTPRVSPESRNPCVQRDDNPSTEHSMKTKWNDTRHRSALCRARSTQDIPCGTSRISPRKNWMPGCANLVHEKGVWSTFHIKDID